MCKTEKILGEVGKQLPKDIKAKKLAELTVVDLLLIIAMIAKIGEEK